MGTLPVRVAPAAEPQFAVYEITRVRAGGPKVVPVYAIAHSDGKPGVMSFLQLAPRKGGGWTRVLFWLAMFNATDTQFGVYGATAGQLPVPCPAHSDVCGLPGEEEMYGWSASFRPAAGNRYLVAVPAHDSYVWAPPQWWRVRQVAVGARVVTAPNTSSVGSVAGGRRVEAFHSATAKGGKYGSGVFALVPCDEDADSAGSATLKSDGSDPAVQLSCEPGKDVGFSYTRDGTTWSLTGPVVGEYDWPNRLFVFDYPKR